jgi:alpha-L-glutamate ligase-like protein
VAKTKNRPNKVSNILGINHRNAIYLRPYNKRRAKEIADDKLLCKKILTRRGVPTAEIYKVIRNHKQLETINWENLPKSFALKPNIGTGGSGIVVFYGRKRKTMEWIKPDRSTMNVNQIKNHIRNILEGQFSMGNRKDIAIIEERIVNHPLLKKYSYKGVPDVRVIVFNKVPIMAELRLPTYKSDGKANLHAGGIGVGIDIGSGITTNAMIRKGTSLVSDLYEQVETTLDDQNLPLSGIQIPHWKKILHIAIRCQEISGLGFLGADIAIDKYKGPLVFELNARSGLAIQNINQASLRERFERVKGLHIKNADHGIRVAQNLFGGEVEDEIKAVSGRQIIGLVEKITLYSNPQQDSQQKKKIKARDIRAKVRINTGVRTSRISNIHASRLGYKPSLQYFKSLDMPESFESREKARSFLKSNPEMFTKTERISGYIVVSESDEITIRPIIPIDINVAGNRFTSKMIVMFKNKMPYPAVIGRKDLKSYLIDTSKTFLLH